MAAQVRFSFVTRTSAAMLSAILSQEVPCRDPDGRGWPFAGSFRKRGAYARWCRAYSTQQLVGTYFGQHTARAVGTHSARNASLVLRTRFPSFKNTGKMSEILSVWICADLLEKVNSWAFTGKALKAESRQNFGRFAKRSVVTAAAPTTFFDTHPDLADIDLVPFISAK
eukprot:5008176-Pyramimonas_sp.AAC.1